MIIEAFIGLFSHVQVFFIELLGTQAPPAWMGTVGVFAGNLLQSARGLGAWVPWTLVLTIAAFNLSVWVVMFAVKGARWLLGLLPTMGGG